MKILRSGVSAERRKLVEIEACGFLLSPLRDRDARRRIKIMIKIKKEKK